MRLAVWFFALVLAAPAQAVVFTVDSTVDAVDAVPGDGICADSTGACTLRAAIQETNALAGPDEIELPAGNYLLGVGGPAEENAAASGDLDVKDELTVLGAGEETTVVDAAGLDRVFECFGSLTLSDLTVTGGHTTASGGGIVSRGSLSLVQATVSGNFALGWGGGILAWFYGGPGSVSQKLSLLRTTVSGNTAGSAGNPVGAAGGGIYVFAIEAEAPRSDGWLEVRESTISENSSARLGGGLVISFWNSTGPITQPARLIDSVVSQNVSEEGAGGIHLSTCNPYVQGSGHLVVTDTTVSGNASFAGPGGLLVNCGSRVTVERSTFESNVGTSAAAIENYGGYAAIRNSTLSGNFSSDFYPVIPWTTLLNRRGTPRYGGPYPASTSLVNTTVSANFSGGLVTGSNVDETLTMAGTIVAGQLNGWDCWGPTISNGHNIDGDGTCNLTDPTDLPVTDPLLGPLQDNGGPTWTHALLPGSVAIDAIPAADCTYDDDDDPGTPEVPVATDQRGVPRPQSPCDIGAYEVTECADGVNNDTDAFTDLDDPGCRDATSVREDPQCQDGLNNDPGQDPDPGLIDFDGGESIWGVCAGLPGGCPPGVSDPDGDGVADPDPQCVGLAWKNKEKTGCGLGFELALILPCLMWLHRQRRRVH